MSVIKFSHTYRKLRDCNEEIIKTARLVGVYKIYLEEEKQCFFNYDTDNGAYKLPPKGLYIMLLFLKPDGKNLFTTLRRFTNDKHQYYWGKVGETFNIVITE